MLAAVPPARTPNAGTVGTAFVPILPSLPVERSVYGAPCGANSKAFLITLAIHAVVIAALTLRFSGTYTVARPSAPLVVTLLPLASPPEPDRAEKEQPTPEREKSTRQIPPKVKPFERTIMPLTPAETTPPLLDVLKVDPSLRQTETGGPKAAPAPPTPQAQSNAPDSWESRVLARLEKFRRYPGVARSARQQGVVYIRFRINRDGHVLSSSLARSSGYPALDQAAIETLRRADPLPKIPAERPDEIEISVPVEFYIR